MCNCDLPQVHIPTSPGFAGLLKELRFPDATVDALLVQRYVAAVPHLQTLVVATLMPGTDLVSLARQSGCRWQEVTVLRPVSTWSRRRVLPAEVYSLNVSD